MISEDALSTAVERGILTSEQAVRLKELEDARTANGAEPEDAEKLRFIAGFGDIFVTLGIVLFLGAAGYFLDQLAGSFAVGAGLAVASWALAEFFTRQRRMALPSIVLLIAFATACFLFWSSAIQTLQFGPQSGPPAGPIGKFQGDTLAFGTGSLIAILCVALHYRRFGVPITIAAGAALAGLAFISLVSAIAPELLARWINIFAFGLGLAFFALAMRFDMSDPERVTRRTDIAFWLHLLAAPLIVHPLVSGLSSATPSLSIENAMAILALFFALGAVAVLIDRRALLVSGLVYAGTAFAVLLRETGVTGNTAPLTLLVLGAFVLLLSAGWRPLRTSLIRLLPGDLARRLPHPMSSMSP